MHAAAVTDVATFAFCLVTGEKFANLVTGNLVKAGKNVPLQVGRVLLVGYEPRAGENVPVGRHPDVPVVHVAGILPEPFARKQ